MLPSSTQALILALRLRGPALPHDRTIAKQKAEWHKESGRMEATATTTHIGGSTFSEVGGKTNVSDALKTKEGDSVHSTFSTNKEWKRVGGLCQRQSLGVNDDHYITSFHSFLEASSLCYAEMMLVDERVTLDWTSREPLEKLSNHSKPGHAQVTYIF